MYVCMYVCVGVKGLCVTVWVLLILMNTVLVYIEYRER